MTRSVKSFRSATELFPGGVNSPVRAYTTVGGDPPLMARGAGSRVWDVEDREYVDFIGGYGPLIHCPATPQNVEALDTHPAYSGHHRPTDNKVTNQAAHDVG